MLSVDRGLTDTVAALACSAQGAGGNSLAPYAAERDNGGSGYGICRGYDLCGAGRWQ